MWYICLDALKLITISVFLKKMLYIFMNGLFLISISVPDDFDAHIAC